MTEPKDLLIVNEQLRRSNRRWKALALAACAVLILAVLFGVANVERERVRAEAARQRADSAFVEAHQARLDAQHAANPGQPR
jgi:membrane-anchored protein YejM (alkaline phosphatase superfamily)